MTNKPLTFFLVKTQFENVGDALINRELISLLSRHSEVFVFADKAPAYFIDQLDLDGKSVRVHAGGLASLLASLIVRRLLGEKVFFFLAPGGNVGEKSYAGYFLNQAYNGLLSILKTTGVRVVQFGASYETLGSRYRSVVLYRAKSLWEFVVRDRSSLNYLNQIGISPTGTAPDLAFGLRYAQLKKTSGFNTPSRIAFSFRTDGKHISKKDIINLVETVANKFPSTKLTFIYQVKRDREFMSHLFDIWSKRDSSRAELFDGSETIKGCQDLYSEHTYLFSNRLHALLIGLSVGCMPIPTLYSTSDFKIRGIFEELEANSHVLDFDRDWQLSLNEAVWVDEKLSAKAATMTSELDYAIGRIFQ